MKTSRRIFGQLLIVLGVVTFVGSLPLRAQCSKWNGSGAEIERGFRYSSSCVNSGYVNQCRWVNCNGSVFCNLDCQPLAMDYGDAFNDSCWMWIACGCSRNPLCSQPA